MAANEGSNPTVRRRRLGMELRRLREAAGMSNEEVCERLEWSSAKLSRVENARQGVNHGDVADLCDLYEAGEDIKKRLVTLAREARRRGWWQTYNDVLPAGQFSTYIGLEAAASELSVFNVELIPGLLQTPDYARALFRSSAPPKTDTEIERMLTVRLERQKLLGQSDPLHMWLVLDEVALLRPVGGREVMRGQLHHLIQAAQKPHITVQILPLSAGAHQAMDDPFAVLNFADDEPSAVYLENLVSSLYLEGQDDVKRYTVLFDHLRATALSTRESIDVITGRAEDF